MEPTVAQGQIASAQLVARHTTMPDRSRHRGNDPQPPWRSRISLPSASALLFFLGCAATAAYGVFIAAGSPKGPAGFFDLIVYHVPILAAACICAIRAHRSPEVRGVWVAFALGLTSWLAADVYYVEELQYLKRIPYPSWADAAYLLALPCFFVGIGLMVRYRIGSFNLAGWLDGAIAALAFACVGSALLAPALIGLTSGDPSVVFTNLAYPIGDLILLAFLVGALTVGGMRGSSSLLAVAVGLAIWAGADAVYLYLIATDTYVGGWIDLFWPIGALAIAAGALPSSQLALDRARDYHASIVIPLIAALAAIFVLMLDHFDRVSTASVWLGGATLVVVAIRLLVGSGENRRLVSTLSHDSVTDPLTGLGNRRRLFSDLDRLLRTRDGRGSHLALFDLDGFKTYNDAFGHSLGDALLRNLGLRLRDSARSGGAYRLGGDEFCVLIESWPGDPQPEVERLRSALAERGEGFEISASCGLVRLGEEARTANEALRIADQRMYDDKGSRARLVSHREAHDVLLGVLREREPNLEQHVEGVAALAKAIARHLGLDAEGIDTITRAAELHDVGKVAVPDAILRKPGPLTEDEWTLMREHTLIGERILGTVPALRPVGMLVRSSHERWDGRGYPDALAGERIPLGARIIFVCDAYDAMIEDRPYQPAKSEAEAIAELKKHAGVQFDPEVVRIFCELHEAGAYEPEEPTSKPETGIEPVTSCLQDRCSAS